MRDLLLNEGVVLPITNFLDIAKPGSQFIKNASWTLSNLCRGRPSPQFSQIKTAIISLAKVLVDNDNEDIIIDICWAFSHYTDEEENSIPFILETGCLSRLI